MGADPQRRELIGYACGTGTSTCVPRNIEFADEPSFCTPQAAAPLETSLRTSQARPLAWFARRPRDPARSSVREMVG